MLSAAQVRRLKEVLRATSSPLAFESFSSFAEAVLSPLITLLSGHGGNLFITDGKATETPLFLWHSYDQGLVQDYQKRFFEQSPIHLMVPKGVRVGRMSDHVDYDRFQKTDFYNDFLRPRRIHHMATLLARLPERGSTGGSLGVLGLHRTRSQEEFASEELELLDLLSDPVRSALFTLVLAGNEREHLEQAFASLPVGVLVLSWGLERLYQNPVLERSLARNDLAPDELDAIREAARHAKDRYLARVDEPGPSARVTIRRGGADLALRVSVLPEGLMSARPHLLCLLEGEERSLPNVSLSQGRFGLTDRELVVVEHCILGLTNAQIANAMGIAPETVKHHLKNIFDKIGVDRRSQLAAVLSAHPSNRGLTGGGRSRG